MKLTPQTWIWDGPDPAATWLAKCPTDVPLVWQARLTDNLDRQARLFSFLSDDERDRLARLRQWDDQQRFLVGRGVLRLLVGAYLKNLPAKLVKFAPDAGGKLFLAPTASAPPLHFNISHSGELVLLAFSPEQAVGVDVEAVRPDCDCEAMIHQVFSHDEQRDWRLLDPEERRQTFFQAWTRREAGLKAMGLGLADEFTTLPAAGLRGFDLVLPAGYRGAAVMRDT